MDCFPLSAASNTWSHKVFYSQVGMACLGFWLWLDLTRWRSLAGGIPEGHGGECPPFARTEEADGAMSNPRWLAPEVVLTQRTSQVRGNDTHRGMPAGAMCCWI